MQIVENEHEVVEVAKKKKKKKDVEKVEKEVQERGTFQWKA